MFRGYEALNIVYSAGPGVSKHIAKSRWDVRARECRSVSVSQFAAIAAISSVGRTARDCILPIELIESM